jgi:phosphatidylserine/phosphatidylglycerophosphate/cardiolipin synthase-like enzyme
MSFVITSTITCYLLPEDGPAAQTGFLKHLNEPGETWIIAYGFTLPDMITDLLQAHKNGVPLHIYLDHTQSAGKIEHPLVLELVNAGVEVTIGTSPDGSKYICHTKGMVSDKSNAGGLYCWEGSTNFSTSAWHQVNTALVFSSTEWRNEFVAQFEGLRDYAWANERAMQLMHAPPPDLGKAPAASRQRYGLTPVPEKNAVAGLGGHAMHEKRS